MSGENIAIMLDSAPKTWSSQEDRFLCSCEALIKRGARPVLIFAERPRQDIYERFRASGAEVEAINYENGLNHYLKELNTLVKRFSITTAHIIYFDYFSAIAWLTRLTGVSTIIYEMQNSGVFRAQTWRKSLLQLRTKVSTKPITRVIAISEFIKQQLVKSGIPKEKTVVRYLGVDPNRFCPNPRAREQLASQFSIGPGELVLSTVSYLRPFKNTQTIVDACSILRERGVHMRLFVAGDGDMLAELKDRSCRLGVSERIHWLGNVADPTVLLQASDIFLLASVGEAFGLVLTEAMACGVPVVGSRSGSLPEVVEDGITGLLVPPLDPNAFADSIEGLATNEELRKKMGFEGIERVKRHFTVDLAVKETIRIYESIWSED